MQPENDIIITQKNADRKMEFLHALASDDVFGVEGKALKKIGATRWDLREWKREDPLFVQAIADIQESQVDFAESKLFDLIRKENPIAIVFFLKTRAKHRGYCEDSGLVNPSSEPVIFQIGSQTIKIE